MTTPEGTLTAAQHEILEVIWGTGNRGATVSEIWEAISQQRSVARTTILNQVDRLEKRGWLSRRKQGGVYRYIGAQDRARTAASLAEEFVTNFFGGSASELVMSLLGSHTLQRAEIERLRQLLESQASDTEEQE